MDSTITRPFDNLAATTIGTTVLSVPAFFATLSIRCGADARRFHKTIAQLCAMKVADPVCFNSTANAIAKIEHGTADDAMRIVWAAPDEWFLHLPAARAADICTQMTAACASLHASIVDVSDYYCHIDLAGADARAVLAQNMTVDTHATVLRPGAAIGTNFQQAQIHLLVLDDDRFRLQMRCSFAPYVLQHLQFSMKCTAAIARAQDVGDETIESG